MAKEGVVFNNAIANASWTKVSTPTILTGLYPSTHGVVSSTIASPRLPPRSRKLYRAAGYATLSLSSVAFHGPVHKPPSGIRGTARERFSARPRHAAVERRPRASTSIDSSNGSTATARCRSSPICTSSIRIIPYEPYAPVQHEVVRSGADGDRIVETWPTVTKLIEDPFMRVRGLPNRAEVIKAGLDPSRIRGSGAGLV